MSGGQADNSRSADNGVYRAGSAILPETQDTNGANMNPCCYTQTPKVDGFWQTFNYRTEKLLCGLYASNDPSERVKSFRQLNLQLQHYEYSSIMMMGDFNGVISTQLDKQKINKKPQKGNMLPKTFSVLIHEYDLRDIWRFKKVKRKEFTHLSA